jgi:7,8-dihydro-6-hydroxymethylpterin-pyrophosphokinase
LQPLKELAADFVHPVLGQTVAELAAKVGSDNIIEIKKQTFL